MSVKSYPTSARKCFVITMIALTSFTRQRSFSCQAFQHSVAKRRISDNHRSKLIQTYQRPNGSFQTHYLRRTDLHALTSEDKQLAKRTDDVTPETTRNSLLILATVPVAWGTFEPAVRFIYQVVPDAPALLISVAYYIIASSVLTLLASRNSPTIDEQPSPTASEDEPTIFTTKVQGGLELGTYLFVGNLLQIIGLKTVPSDRAAFLLQLTTIFVPVMEGIFAGSFFAISNQTWLACIIALLGVGLIGFGPEDISSLIPSDSSMLLTDLSISQGDMWIILAAFSYTFHCLRLQRYAQVVPAVQLAAAKATAEAAWSTLFVFLSIFVAMNIDTAQSGGISANILQIFSNDGNSILDYSSKIADGSVTDSLIASDSFGVLAAIAWIGIVTVGYTIYAQSVGQATVKPTTANLIYSSQPIWTVLLAWLVLGETATQVVYAGGALIGLAVFLVLRDNEEESV